MSLEGKQIDRYRILRLLGRGGMGDVYLAEDARIEQQVALKVIRIDTDSYANSEAAQEIARLSQREAKAIVKLDHPNILSLFDYGEEQIDNMTIIYLVMPFRAEGSLADLLKKRTSAALLLPKDVISIIGQAASALQHAHDHNIIHQDVKPSNFLIRNNEENPDYLTILLADFGIARLITATSSMSQSVRGTPTYMAPELWEGTPVAASDQYALAIMAYELLTGQPPFQGSPGRMMYQHINTQPAPPSTLNPNLTADIDTVLLHGLAKKPEERFASITAFAHAFQQAVDDIQTAPTALIQHEISRSESNSQRHETFSNDLTYVPSPALATGKESVSVDNTKAIAQPILDTQASTVGEQTSTESQEIRSAAQEKITPLPAIPTIMLPISEPGIPLLPTKRKPIRLLSLVGVVLILLLLSSGLFYTLAMGKLSLGGSASSVNNASLGKNTPTSTTPSTSGGTAGVKPHTPTTSSSSTSQSTTSSSSNTSGSSAPTQASTAAVTIVPSSVDVQHGYTISVVTGTPDASQQQVSGARMLSTTTSSQTQTVNATGQGTIPGTNASGIACVDNFDTSNSVTLQSGSVYANTYSSINIHMVLDATVTVPPAPSAAVFAQRCIAAHILEVGTIGNNEFNSNISGSLSWSVFNNPPFSNGKDSQTYVAVQQSDIDGAANTLINANNPDAQQVLQPQMQANEQMIGTPHCKSNTTANHVAGDRASTVTVTVNFTCMGEVYNSNNVYPMAARLLTNQAASSPGAGYALVGNIVTKIIQASAASGGTVAITVTAEGIWVFQFSNGQQQNLASLIAGKSQKDALTTLQGQQGVAKVTLQLSGGDGSTVSSDTNKITIVIQAPSGL